MEDTTLSSQPISSSSSPPETATGSSRTGDVEILLVGWSPESRDALSRLAGQSLPVTSAPPDEALQMLEGHEVAVLCLGGELRAEAAKDYLEQALERSAGRPPVNLVLAGGSEPLLFQDLVSEDKLYFLTQEPVLDADLVAILESALDRARFLRQKQGDGEMPAGQAPHVLQTIVEVARRVALQRELDQAGQLTVEAIREVVDADRAYYLIYEPEHEVLFSGDPGSRNFREESAAVGLVSFVARTGRAILRDRMGDDPRYERQADDPEGTGRERLLATPVKGSTRKVLAVLVAVRDESKPTFSDRDLVNLEILADQVASAFSQLALQAQIDKELRRREQEMREGSLNVFRDEAVDHYVSGRGAEGHVLRISPEWTRWTYWMLLGLLLAALVFGIFGTLREYATGPAVVRMEGNQELTATSPGVVSSVMVSPGDPVEAGDPLVLFYGAQEAAELARIEREFELQLINRLRNPSDRGAEQALISLRAQRELARSRLEERTLRAPADGRVADVRVREGQSVAPGGAVVSLVSDRTEPVLWVLLPGHFRPLLEPGMDLRFEVQGYEYAYVHVPVETVSAEVIGPTETRRFLGPVIGDSIAVAGPVVVVTARLPSSTFESGGDRYTFHDGMYGRAEVAVRSDRILIALFPRLKVVTEMFDDAS